MEINTKGNEVFKQELASQQETSQNLTKAVSALDDATRKRLPDLVGSTPLIDSSNRGVQACSGSRFESLNSKLAQARTLQRQASLHPSLQKQRECTLIPAVALRVLSIRYACVLQEAP